MIEELPMFCVTVVVSVDEAVTELGGPKSEVGRPEGGGAIVGAPVEPLALPLPLPLPFPPPDAANTPKDCWTWVAVAYASLGPEMGSLKSTLHVPDATKRTTPPLSVHPEDKASRVTTTTSPEDAVALGVYVGPPTTALLGAPVPGVMTSAMVPDATSVKFTLLTVEPVLTTSGVLKWVIAYGEFTRPVQVGSTTIL